MKNKLFQAVLLCVILLIVIRGEKAVMYAQKSAGLCADMLLPSLFPFFVCSGLLIYSGFCESTSKIFAPLMKPLFNVNPNGSAAFVLGIISGYPLGAVTVCNLYEGFYISKAEAERMLGFCNNSGPLFILGAVGTGLYSGLHTGVMLYAVHIAAALLTGIAMRFYKKDDFSAPYAKIAVKKESPAAGFGDVLENSVRSMLNVCGTVIFFGVISGLVLDFVNLDDGYEALLGGILELSGGVKGIAELNTDFRIKMILSAFAVGFAGIGVHVQVLAAVSKCGLSMKPYIAGKLFHGCVSAGLMYCVMKCAGAVQNSGRAALSGGFAIGSLCITATAAILIVAGAVFRLKHKKNERIVRNE